MTRILVGETGLCYRVHRDSTFDFKRNTVNGCKGKKINAKIYNFIGHNKPSFA